MTAAEPAEALPASLEWQGEVLPLEPVDELPVLTVCDNVLDMLLPDRGPAKRLPLAGMARAPMLEAPTILGGKVADVPLAQDPLILDDQELIVHVTTHAGSLAPGHDRARGDGSGAAAGCW